MKKHILIVIMLIGLFTVSCGKEEQEELAKTEFAKKQESEFDKDPPVIHNVPELIEIYQFEDISVQQILDEANVYVTDNADKNLTYTIDSTNLNIEEIGQYDIILMANDSHQNITQTTIPIKVQFDPSIPKDFIEYRKFIGRSIVDAGIDIDNLEDNNEFITYGNTMFYGHEGVVTIQYNLTTNKIWSIFLMFRILLQIRNKKMS